MLNDKNIKVVVSESIAFEQIDKNFYILVISDQDGRKYKHEFKDNDKITKEFKSLSHEEFKERYTNATFVFSKNHESFSNNFDLYENYSLVDYRNSYYKGFIQSEEMMNDFSKEIGLKKATPESKSESLFKGIKSIDDLFNKYKTNKFNVNLTGEKSDFNFGLDKDNEFTGSLSFSWNPFEKSVSTVVEIQRLKCLNGMFGLSPLLRNNIPIVNNISEHLDIAKSYISDNLKMILKEKLEVMTKKPASLHQARMVYYHAKNREASNFHNASALERLKKIAFYSDIKEHCKCYKDSVLYSSDVAKLYPSHLTQYDIWNLLTEIDSHTKEGSDSTSKVIQTAINRLMFEESHAMSDSVKLRSDVGAEHSTAFWGSDSLGY